MRRVLESTLTFILSAALAACAGASAQAPPPAEPAAAPSAFPSAAELSALAAPAPRPLPRPGLEVARWDLAGPFPDAIEVHAALSAPPWSTLLAGAPGGAAVTEDMTCVARELGRFYLEHSGAASDSLRRSVAGWCGVAAIDVDVRFLGGDAPADVSDDALFAAWKAQAVRLVAAQAGGERHAGLWFGRAGGRAVLAVASGVPRVQLERLPLAPDAHGEVSLRGTLLAPTAELHVRVNRGLLGVADCALDASVTLPRFSALCAVDAADATAWIEVDAVAPRHLLGKPVLRVLARRADAKPTYALAEAAPGAAAATLLELVNQARHEAGLAALAPAEREAEVARRLAPTYFADSFAEGAGLEADRIALGLMAGWDVDAMVAGAGVYSAMVRSADPRHLVAACLESPAGRSVLLDARATHLALAELHDGADLGAGLFVTYRTLVDDPAADAARGFELVAHARAARGLSAPQAMTGIEDEVVRLGARVRAGDVSPEDAESHLLARAIRATGASGLHGAVAEASDLEAVKLPDEAFAPGALSLAAFAAPYRPADQPWWRWAVVVVSADAR